MDFLHERIQLSRPLKEMALNGIITFVLYNVCEDANEGGIVRDGDWWMKVERLNLRCSPFTSYYIMISGICRWFNQVHKCVCIHHESSILCIKGHAHLNVVSPSGGCSMSPFLSQVPIGWMSDESTSLQKSLVLSLPSRRRRSRVPIMPITVAMQTELELRGSRASSFMPALKSLEGGILDCTHVM